MGPQEGGRLADVVARGAEAVDHDAVAFGLQKLLLLGFQHRLHFPGQAELGLQQFHLVAQFGQDDVEEALDIPDVVVGLGQGDVGGQFALGDLLEGLTEAGDFSGGAVEQEVAAQRG